MAGIPRKENGPLILGASLRLWLVGQARNYYSLYCPVTTAQCLSAGVVRNEIPGTMNNEQKGQWKDCRTVLRKGSER